MALLAQFHTRVGNCQWILSGPYVCSNVQVRFNAKTETKSAPRVSTFPILFQTKQMLRDVFIRTTQRLLSEAIIGPMLNVLPFCSLLLPCCIPFWAISYKTDLRARAEGADIQKTCWPAGVINCVSKRQCRGLGHLFFGQCYVGAETWTLNVICS